MKVRIGPYRKNRATRVEIEPYDTWSMDCTLAMIIHPMLDQTFYSQMLLSTRVDVERERGDDEDDDRDARQHRLEPLLPSYPPCKLSRRGRS